MHLLLSAVGAGAAPAEVDAALLAFVKCHVSSAAAWDLLRALGERPGEWLTLERLVRSSHRRVRDAHTALTRLVAEGVVIEQPGDSPASTSYSLPAYEPTTVLLRRLVEECVRNQSLREIVVAHVMCAERAGRKAA